MVRDCAGHTWTYDPAHRRWYVDGTRLVVYVGDKGSDGHTATWLDGLGGVHPTLPDAFMSEADAEMWRNVGNIAVADFNDLYESVVNDAPWMSCHDGETEEIFAHYWRTRTTLTACQAELLRQTDEHAGILDASQSASFAWSEKYNALHLRLSIYRYFLFVAVVGGVIGWLQ